MTGLGALAAVLSWLLHATIKGSVVIVIVAVLQWLLRDRVDARWRHALWLVVLLRLALPVAPSSSWSIFNLIPETTSAVRPAATTVSSQDTMVRLPSLVHARSVNGQSQAMVTALRWMFGVWLVGFLAIILRITVSSLLLNRAVRRALLCGGSPQLQVLVDQASHRVGVTRAVRALECDFVRTPALHGLIHPTLLLPAGLAESFTRDELRHVVLHELWHQRRLDVAVNWVLSAVQALHWFNPFVWFATSRIKEERELACDELALSCLEQEERPGYGMTILKLLETFRTAVPVPALVGIVNNKQKMKRRLMMIASYKNRTRFSILFAATVAVVGVVGLTDARGGERHMVKTSLDPAAVATIEKLDKRVSLDLTNATFPEFLSAIASSAGVNVTQAPEVANSPVQQARFTLHAENVPLHALLHESLSAFQLAPTPTAEGVVVTTGSDPVFTIGDHVGQMKTMRHIETTDDSSTGDKKIERVVIMRHANAGDAADAAGLDPVAPAAPGEKKMTMRITVNGTGEAQIGADGKLHRELNMKTNENGTESEGRLVLDIQAPPPVK